jgi:predicted CXXCH cytochrome family protein
MPRSVQVMVLALIITSSPPSGAQSSPPATRVSATAEHPAVTGAEGAACTSCHADVLKHRVAHGPAAAGQCGACHVETKVANRRRMGLKSGASDRRTAALCTTCHTDIAERLTARHRHAPVAAGDCTACHDPHGSAVRFQLPAEGNRACTTCHEDIAQTLALSHAHAPALAACQLCHDPHAASARSQLRVPENTLCLTCHFEQATDTPEVDRGSIFGPHPRPDLDRLISTGRRIGLDPSLAAGHPTVAHPVDGRPDPRVKGRTLGCASCHNPHGARTAKLFRFGATNVSALCVQCHPF